MASPFSSSTKHQDTPTDPGKPTIVSPRANPDPDPEAQNYNTFAFPYDPSSPEGVPPPRKQGGGGNLSLVVFGLVIIGIVLLFALS
ncbi:hypothetical protein BDV27DRAFT_160976 [Aspergillus caelatus]|uniref:Uncharacterized protein n=2 Tax=Aspergillus subgen. Circumdati TaxID=2720871 RepID=A0A5N6ZW11_9EURO|nr:uncharacterized protein BDV27DRAFT_160976 [Aspergillus caelatus]KAE8361136.1 hypothetical protein BDV27DRAFT_160976 [Aspergillus caelatus]KAE8420611.1 hypothetical protein BDV36DRAFT_249217 [Aspergillus pseudocaelatus]